MNAAARLVQQSVLSRHLVWTYQLTWRQVWVLVLSMGVLLSAVSTIYVTHLTRITQAAYQHDVLAQNSLYIERGQLLLERSTWMLQDRIQSIAQNKLGMIIPNQADIVVVHE